MSYLVRDKKQLRDATVQSLKGLSAVGRDEVEFRQYIVFAVILLPLAFYLADNMTERVMQLISAFLVLLRGVVNAAIQATVDCIGKEAHELSGLAKDIGSGAVFFEPDFVRTGLVNAAILSWR